MTADEGSARQTLSVADLEAWVRRSAELIGEHAEELTELDSAGADEGVIAMVNGMGATPLLELYLMYGEISRLLRDAGITVARNLVGNYITSLDMAGCSLTLVRADAELLSLWDAPVNTPGLRWGA